MVEILFHGPEWFYGPDSILEGIAAFVSLFACLLSWKAWKLAKLKQYYYFSISFGLMTIGMAARALVNYLVFQELPKTFETWGYGLHIALYLLALIMLLTLAVVIRQRRMFILLFLLLFGTLYFAQVKYLAFYYLSTVLLGAIAYHYYENWKKKKTFTTQVVMGSFGLLALGQLLFALSAYMSNLFLPAHFSQIAGYVLLFIALVKVILK